MMASSLGVMHSAATAGGGGRRTARPGSRSALAKQRASVNALMDPDVARARARAARLVHERSAAAGKRHGKHGSPRGAREGRSRQSEAAPAPGRGRSRSPARRGFDAATFSSAMQLIQQGDGVHQRRPAALRPDEEELGRMRASEWIGRRDPRETRCGVGPFRQLDSSGSMIMPPFASGTGIGLKGIGRAALQHSRPRHASARAGATAPLAHGDGLLATHPASARPSTSAAAPQHRAPTARPTSRRHGGRGGASPRPQTSESGLLSPESSLDGQGMVQHHGPEQGPASAQQSHLLTTSSTGEQGPREEVLVDTGAWGGDFRDDDGPLSESLHLEEAQGEAMPLFRETPDNAVVAPGSRRRASRRGKRRHIASEALMPTLAALARDLPAKELPHLTPHVLRELGVGRHVRRTTMDDAAEMSAARWAVASAVYGEQASSMLRGRMRAKYAGGVPWHAKRRLRRDTSESGSLAASEAPSLENKSTAHDAGQRKPLRGSHALERSRYAPVADEWDVSAPILPSNQAAQAAPKAKSFRGVSLRDVHAHSRDHVQPSTAPSQNVHQASRGLLSTQRIIALARPTVDPDEALAMKLAQQEEEARAEAEAEALLQAIMSGQDVEAVLAELREGGAGGEDRAQSTHRALDEVEEGGGDSGTEEAFQAALQGRHPSSARQAQGGRHEGSAPPPAREVSPAAKPSPARGGSSKPVSYHKRNVPQRGRRVRAKPAGGLLVSPYGSVWLEDASWWPARQDVRIPTAYRRRRQRGKNIGRQPRSEDAGSAAPSEPCPDSASLEDRHSLDVQTAPSGTGSSDRRDFAAADEDRAARHIQAAFRAARSRRPLHLAEADELHCSPQQQASGISDSGALAPVQEEGHGTSEDDEEGFFSVRLVPGIQVDTSHGQSSGPPGQKHLVRADTQPIQHFEDAVVAVLSPRGKALVTEPLRGPQSARAGDRRSISGFSVGSAASLKMSPRSSMRVAIAEHVRQNASSPRGGRPESALTQYSARELSDVQGIGDAGDLEAVIASADGQAGGDDSDGTLSVVSAVSSVNPEEARAHLASVEQRQARISARTLSELAALVGQLDGSHIVAMVDQSKPSDDDLVVAAALMVLLGVPKPNWKRARKVMLKGGFLDKLCLVAPTMLDEKHKRVAREILRKHSRHLHALQAGLTVSSLLEQMERPVHDRGETKAVLMSKALHAWCLCMTYYNPETAGIPATGMGSMSSELLDEDVLQAFADMGYAKPAEAAAAAAAAAAAEVVSGKPLDEVMEAQGFFLSPELLRKFQRHFSALRAARRKAAAAESTQELVHHPSDKTTEEAAASIEADMDEADGYEGAFDEDTEQWQAAVFGSDEPATPPAKLLGARNALAQLDPAAVSKLSTLDPTIQPLAVVSSIVCVVLQVPPCWDSAQALFREPTQLLSRLVAVRRRDLPQRRLVLIAALMQSRSLLPFTDGMLCLTGTLLGVFLTWAQALISSPGTPAHRVRVPRLSRLEGVSYVRLVSSQRSQLLSLRGDEGAEDGQAQALQSLRIGAVPPVLPPALTGRLAHILQSHQALASGKSESEAAAHASAVLGQGGIHSDIASLASVTAMRCCLLRSRSRIDGLRGLLSQHMCLAPVPGHPVTVARRGLLRLGAEDINMFRKQPEPLKLECVAVGGSLCCLLGVEPSWPTVVRVMSDPDAMLKLCILEPWPLRPAADNVVRAKRLLQANEAAINKAMATSTYSVAKALYQWLVAFLMHVGKPIHPNPGQG